jgi:hypothetical protein
MTGCDATQIIETISKIAEGVQQAMPAIQTVVDTFKNIFGGDDDNADAAQAAQDTTETADTATETNTEEAANVVTVDPNEEEVANATTDTTTEAGATGDTGTTQTTEAATETATTTDATTEAAATTEPADTSTNETSELQISDDAQKQMNDVVAYALANNRGASNGQCFNAVWGYLTNSGYGNLKEWADLPAMQSGLARNFSDYLNASQRNLDEAGLKRLDTTLTPPITSPHDPRIPKGAVIVVAPGSYGTSDPVAGDIVIKAGEGRFVNDGPNMDYGTSSNWYGEVLGVYIPK